MFNVKIEENLDQVKGGLRTVVRRFPNLFDRAIQISAKKTQIVMIRKSPKDSGQFSQKFFTERERRFVWVVDNKAKHKNFVEFGTGLFNENGPRKRIRPVRAKFMLFPVSAKRYNLPIWEPPGSGRKFFIVTRAMKGIKGQKPKRIFRSTVKTAEKIMTVQVVLALKQIRKRLDRVGRTS